MIEPAKVLGIGLVAGGGLYAVGGMLHPRGSGDTRTPTSRRCCPRTPGRDRISRPAPGLVLIAVTLIATARTSNSDSRAGPGSGRRPPAQDSARPNCSPTAASDLSHLEHGDSTPILDTHLLLQTVATPALG